MENKKWFIKSKTVIGGLVTILPVLASMLGLNLTPDEAATVSINVQNLIVQGVQLGGFLLMLYGRFTAREQITVGPNAP